MRITGLPGYLRDTVLRLLPHRAPTGLFAVGLPDPSSPILVTGNYTLTVRRMREVLAGRDAWLLCVDSKGINVWCAAGGGHLTHHDVISAIRVAGLEEHGSHRLLILPQLAATGVERRPITEATGFETRWGPARLEDLPAYLDRGAKVHPPDRIVRFPLWERIEMASVWFLPALAVVVPLEVLLFGAPLAAAGAAAVLAAVVGIFAALPAIDLRGVRRVAAYVGFGLFGLAVGTTVLAALGAATAGQLAVLAATCTGIMAVLAVDLPGTTPWYGSAINTLHSPARIELREDRCSGAGDCVQVCPRDVFSMDGARRKVTIARPAPCIQCGACIVQCPEDALQFRFGDGAIADADLLRRTHLNLLGRRVGRPGDRPPL